MRAASILPVGIACLAFAACSGSSASPPPALVRYVPADAVVIVSTERFDSIRERAKQSAWARFLGDERLGLTALVEKLRSAAAGAGEGAGEGEWRWINAVLEEMHGGAVLYAQHVDGAPTDAVPNLVLLLDPERDVAGLRSALDALLATTDLEGPVVDELGGVEMQMRERGTTSVAIFEHAGLVALASAESRGIEALALDVLARLRGEAPTPSILTQPGYAVARGAGVDPVIEMHLQLPELLGAFDTESLPKDHLVRLLGIDRIGWVHMRAHIGAGEELGIALAVELPRSTVVGRFADLLGPLPDEFLVRLPAEADGAGFGNFDVPGFLSGLRAFLTESSPALLGEYESGLAEARSEAKLDLEAVARAFSGRFASFTMRVPPAEMGEPAMLVPGGELDPALSSGTAYFAELHDVDVVRDAVERTVDGMELREIVETVSVGGVPVHGAARATGRFTWAFLEDGVVFGLQPTPVRAFVELATSGGLSAADDAVYAKALSAYDDCAMLQIVPTATWVGSILATLQMTASLFLPLNDPDLGLGELAFFRTPGMDLASEHFSGATVTGVRRDGDRLELLVETK